MKFSVLLPTRNGERYLKDCIASVLDHTDTDFELVISDNCNMDGTPQILENFKTDPRVKIVRSHSVLSVSENWKNALENSSGDYIVMLGDDDSLLPGYFERMRAILEKYDNPDCVLHNAYSFVTPESVEGNSISYYCPSHFNFDSDLQTEQIIPMKVRRSIVHDMFRFKVRIPLNMQTTMFSRKYPGQCAG